MNNDALSFIKQNQELWTEFKNPLHVWHSTKIEYFNNIQLNGIQPGNKQRASSAEAPLPLGVFFKAVCLFDFCAFPDEKIFEIFENWNIFLTHGECSRYWIAINKTSIIDFYFTQKDQKFLDLENSDKPEKYGNRLPYVESWHQGPIPYAAVSYILKISNTYKKYEFERILPTSV